ncbi:MAG TPA: SRPBCC family protein [bacterium]|nr:SRPBCC family protein [bacterium]
MKVFTLRRTLWVPQSIDSVFPFFSDAHNLDRITPKWLQFRSLDHPKDVAEGTRLKHKFKIRGIPVTWVSEITQWDPPYGFVDEQKKGPYRYWRHEHRFREERDGTVCEDVVKYAVLGGALVNRLFIAPDLKKIFDYRQEKLKKIFARI